MAQQGGAVDPPLVDVGLARDLVTVALGFAMGVLSGLFGVGGGVISQPGMRLLGMEPIMVIGTALPVIIPGAASGTRRYWHEGLIRWTAVAATVPAGLLAAIAGSAAAEQVPGEGHLLQLATAALLLLSSYRMARAAHPPADEPLAETDAPEAPSRQPEGTDSVGRCVAIGVVAGGLSGLLGIGGGVIMVPAFVYFVRMEVKAAIATSLVCVGLFAIPGAITHALLGHVDWRVAAALIVGVIPGARVGANLAIRASDRRLRVTVATFLACTAVVYAVAELGALID
jgi:uncharacterized membrane protein YfcA